MNGFILGLLASLASAAPADTVVVCPAPFRAALEPWIQYRQAQGHRLKVIDTCANSAELRSAIVAAADGSTTRSIVLVGDALPQDARRQAAEAITVPTHWIPAVVNVHWGSEPEIATDAWYADLDQDSVPDLAIGRMSVDSAEELALLVQKILAYERVPNIGSWSRRINLIAGVGGYGVLADNVLEMATRKFVTDGIPAAYRTTMTYASWRSPYCPDPRLFRDVTLRRLNEGCLFWIYIGHGQRRHLDYVQVPGGAFPILDIDDVAEMKSSHGAPIALMLACYAGAFDEYQDCLAEAMLRRPGGPIAAICGSRVTMPYAMAVMCDAMMKQYFEERCETIGQLVLQTKRRMLDDAPENPRRQMLDAIAMAISPVRDKLLEERKEHVYLFNLLGDPLLRLPHPGTVSVTAKSTVTGGQLLPLVIDCPQAGTATVELVCRRDRSRTDLPARSRFEPTHKFLRSFDEPYRQINDPVWLTRTVSLPAGRSELVLDVPADAHGPSHVRVALSNRDTFAIGSVDVFIRRPRHESTEDVPE